MSQALTSNEQRLLSCEEIIEGMRMAHPDCDVIVCWEHNWPDCPIEVILLKEEISKLSPDTKGN